MSARAGLWNRMSSELKPKSLSSMEKDISLEEIPDFLKNILLGKITGRTLVKNLSYILGHSPNKSTIFSTAAAHTNASPSS